MKLKELLDTYNDFSLTPVDGSELLSIRIGDVCIGATVRRKKIASIEEATVITGGLRFPVSINKDSVDFLALTKGGYSTICTYTPAQLDADIVLYRAERKPKYSYMLDGDTSNAYDFDVKDGQEPDKTCPICGGILSDDDFDFGDAEWDSDGGSVCWTCPHCDAEGKAVYTNHFLEHIDVSAEEDNDI